VLFLIGALIMVYNCWRTIRGEVRAEEPLARAAPAAAPAE
jgi:cytochrome c oxidase cbb3-type subunit I